MLVAGVAALLVGIVPESHDQTVEDTSVSIIGIGQAIDGDSLIVNGREIRLWGLDAVELHQSCDLHGKPWRCGQAAKQALAEIITATPLTCLVRNTDRYGRAVAECFLSSDRAGNTSLNGLLVEHGWAMAYRRYAEQYIPYETCARDQQRGIWASRFVPPWDWRKGQRLAP
ncbi:MAG: thermonuclease family protein [Leptolyngbya sp. SIOISBB]|nr:thermonuclease family protein [Leptolyngbya sp. SIOISBB]